MRQRKDNQFVEYPLDSSGLPTGEELHSTNGFTECDSFVDSISSPRDIRDTIFTNRRSYGLHILSPFNFERPQPDKLSLEVTKKASGTIPGTDSWGFTVNYTSGKPNGFTAKKNNADCTSEVTDTGSSLKFTLKADETIHIDFDADASFRFEVVEDDPAYLTNITGTGGTADMSSKKFTSTGGDAKATFTNGTTTSEKKPVYLKLKKIAKDDKRPLSGAVFSVYADAACSGTVLTTMTTGADGTAATSVPNIVEDGGSVTLYVKETTAPSGFTPLSTVFTVTCKAPENSTPEGAVQVGPAAGIENGSDEPDPGKTVLYKRDAVTNKGVGPATFKFSSVTNGDYEFTTDKNGELESIQWWDTTEKAGRYIKPGEYAVTKIVPPPGYEPTTEVQQIKLELDGSGKPIPAGPLVFKNLAKVGLRIVKYDRLSHTPMNGVTFEIFHNGTSIGRYETKGNGEILLTGLEPGTYRAVEVDTGDEGHILDTSWQEVELIAGGGTKDLLFFNDNKPGMKLVKVDSSDPSKTIPGVKFSIRAVSGSYGPEEFITDSNGEIDLSMLPEGSYVITELECPGYVIDNAQRVIHLRANDTAEFVFTNTKKPGLRLVKTSADGTPLDGVTFRISKIEDGSRYLDRTTENGGEIFVEDLEPGMYSVQEIATLPDYILDKTEHHVELVPGKTSEIRLKNDKRPWLVISKTDKDTGKPVPGVTFTLRGADGPTITTKPTGEDGKIRIDDLLPGVYTVTEQNVPEGYILDTTPQTVTLFPNREAQVEFQNHQRPSLKIVKVDINGKHLTGALFEVKTKSGVKIGDFPVDANGEILVPQKHLAEGYYIITEIQAPAGYILDPTPHEVYLRPGKTTEVSIENEKKPGLTIMKLDSVVGDGVKGAKFEIWVAKDKNQYGTYQKLDESYYYTDDNGIIHIDGLDTGWYKIKEVEPPEGYMLKAPSEQIVYVEHDKTATVTFENIPKSALIIRKIDAETGKPLANAWFRIRYLSGTSGTGGTIIAERQTSSNGNIILTGLDAGTYIVEEINAPDGYVIDIAPQTAYISGNDQDCITLTFTNSKNGALLIKKIDSVTKAPLSDVRFFVTTSDGGVVGNGNGYYTTDAAGTILVDDIEPSTTLIVKEVETRPGYILDDVPQTAVIKAGQTVQLEFRNQPNGSLIIRKVCSVNPSVTLRNAEFKVAYSDGSLIGDSNGVYRTDENGEIRIDGLTPGRSVVVTETRAPDGFLIDTQPQTAVIQAGKPVSLTFKNQPKGQLIIQKRDSATNKPLPGAEFRVTTAAGCEVGLDGVIGTSTLTQNGIFTSDAQGEIKITNLAPGAYVLNEIKAPDGYVMDTPSTNVVIGANGDTQTVIIKNSKAGVLVIDKRDSLTNKPLAGVTFKVTTSTGEYVPDETGKISSNGLYVTDREGKITIKGVVGTLVVTETKTIPGYTIDPNSRTQTVVVNPNDTQTLHFYNTPGTTLIIKKFIEGTDNEPLSGVAFKVIDGSGAAVGPDDGIYYTDKAGEIVLSDIEPGTTVIAREIKTVEGFVLDGTPQKILIKEGEVQSLTFWNKRDCSLTILKQGTDKTPLEGVTFKITTTNGSFLPDEDGKISSNGLYYTDVNGQIILNSVVGSIVVTEVQTIDGYTISDANRTQTVEVTPDDSQTLYFYNDPLCSLTITKLDSVTGKPVPNTELTVKDSSGNSIGTYTTGRDGTVTVTGLVPNSSIVVTETKVPTGYVLNPIPQTILVKNGTGNDLTSGTSSSNSWSSQGNDLTFENDPKTTLTIEKYLETETGNKPLKGVTFLVTDASGAVIGSSNGEYVTGEDGRIVIPNLEPGVTITAREIKVPEGVILDSSPKSIQIKTGEGQTLRFINKQAGTLVIRKLDKVNKTPIAGAEFELTYAEGGYVDDANGHLSNKGRYTTNDIGEIRLSVTGTVVAKELTPAPGYVIDQTTQIQTVKVNPADTQTLVFYNEPMCSLTLTKRDSVTGKPVPNTEFTLKDGNNNIIGKYTTGSDGTVTVTGLVPGSTVIAVETKVPSGYVLNPTPQTIVMKNGAGNSIVTGSTTLDGNDGNHLDFENDPTTTLVIQKFVDGTENQPMKGVEFLVTDSSGKVVGSNNGYFYTDKDGRITIKNLEPGVTVTARETKTLAGFILDGTPQSIQIKTGEVQALTFWNKKAGGLIVKKIDSDTKKPLAGVQFKITYSDGSFVDMDGGKTSSNGIYTTDVNGEIFIAGIVGTVVVEETKTLPGYVINPDTKKQTVKINPDDTQTLTFENTKAGGLIVKKLDSVTEKPLAGVEFKITYTDGRYVDLDGGKISSKGLYRTDSNGEIFIDGITGNVVVTETKTINGYTIDEKNRSQTVQVNPNDTQTITFYNAPGATVIIQKYVDGSENEPLSGVEFYVTDSAGTPIGSGYYRTDSKGQIVISGVADGTSLVVRETKTVEGYVIDPNPQTIQVSSGKAQTLVFQNKKTGNLIIKKKDSITKEPLAGVEFKVTYTDGSMVDTENGTISSNGTYITDTNGDIRITGIVGSVIITETKTIDGYTINENERSQTVKVNPNDTQTVTFYNVPRTTLVIQKYGDETGNMPLAGVEFLVTDGDGAPVGRENGRYVTDKDGRIVIEDLADGVSITAKETKTVAGYILDTAPQTIKIKAGGVNTLTFQKKKPGL